MSAGGERQILLDTETTGLDPKQGHRIIEIGGVELLNRRLTGRHYHQYIKPDRPVDPEAVAVHGITDDFLRDKPPFEAVVDEFLQFVDGAELVIHNAPFDIGFIDAELGWLNPARGSVTQRCSVVDTLVMARKQFPGQRASLDALCKRYGIDNGHRTLHGALLDAEILADVYLHLTGGQSALSFGGLDQGEGEEGADAAASIDPALAAQLVVQRACEAERDAHEDYLAMIEKQSGGEPRWRALNAG